MHAPFSACRLCASQVHAGSVLVPGCPHAKDLVHAGTTGLPVPQQGHASGLLPAPPPRGAARSCHCVPGAASAWKTAQRGWPLLKATCAEEAAACCAVRRPRAPTWPRAAPSAGHARRWGLAPPVPRAPWSPYWLHARHGRRASLGLCARNGAARRRAEAAAPGQLTLLRPRRRGHSRSPTSEVSGSEPPWRVEPAPGLPAAAVGGGREPARPAWGRVRVAAGAYPARRQDPGLEPSRRGAGAGGRAPLAEAGVGGRAAGCRALLGRPTP